MEAEVKVESGSRSSNGSNQSSSDGVCALLRSFGYLPTYLPTWLTHLFCYLIYHTYLTIILYQVLPTTTNSTNTMYDYDCKYEREYEYEYDYQVDVYYYYYYY